MDWLLCVWARVEYKKKVSNFALSLSLSLSLCVSRFLFAIEDSHSGLERVDGQIIHCMQINQYHSYVMVMDRH